jgi:hypothetical protein
VTRRPATVPTRPTDKKAPRLREPLEYRDKPKTLHALDLGLLAGIFTAIVYGVCDEGLGLSWGLVAVGFIGGIVIGGAVTRGAWANHPHPTLRRLQLMAAMIGVGAWIVGLFVTYLISQALIPQASTPLLERVSFGGFSDYFAGLFDYVRWIHAASVAAMAFMAWRGAR